MRLTTDDGTYAAERSRSQTGGPGIRQWNLRQLQTFQRYGSRYRIPLTVDLIAPLAVRYAEKHATTRPRLLHHTQSG